MARNEGGGYCTNGRCDSGITRRGREAKGNTPYFLVTYTRVHDGKKRGQEVGNDVQIDA